jgi:hypothetical protein
MSLVNAIAASFISALHEDHYPSGHIEGLFGVHMGDEQSQLVLGVWQTLFHRCIH